jgi:hypothetical protein
MIAGQVFDIEGQPVFNATVLALETEHGMGGKVPMAYTGKQGKFLFKRLAPGTYVISVEKTEAGYPPTDFPFYSAGFVEVPRITVYEGQTISNVTVRLGPKAAKIVGRVADAITGMTVVPKDVKITLRRVDNADYSYSTGPAVNGKLEILVPPVPVTIEVSARGYEKRNLGSLHLRQGEVKRLDILLRPVN